MKQANIKCAKAVMALLNQSNQTLKAFAIIARDNVDRYREFITFRRETFTTTSSKDRINHTFTARYTINFFAKQYVDVLESTQKFIDYADNQQFSNLDGYDVDVNISDITEDFDDNYELYVESVSVDLSFKEHVENDR